MCLGPLGVGTPLSTTSDSHWRLLFAFPYKRPYPNFHHQNQLVLLSSTFNPLRGTVMPHYHFSIHFRPSFFFPKLTLQTMYLRHFLLAVLLGVTFITPLYSLYIFILIGEENWDLFFPAQLMRPPLDRKQNVPPGLIWHRDHLNPGFRNLFPTLKNPSNYILMVE